MQTIMDGLEQEFEDRMDFISLSSADGDLGGAAFRYDRLRGHPSVVIVKHDGTVILCQTGVSSRDDIGQAIRQALKP